MAGPAADQSYFRRRFLLPIPPDNVSRQESRLAGFHPVIMDHNHSPALSVLPNGDVLFIAYSSEREYEPEVAMIATRLRFGAEDWDAPEVLFDFADANEHSPCLFTHPVEGWTAFFWGTPAMPNATPFQWTVSRDSGATWSAPRFPVFPEPVGPHSRQPISGPFIGGDGTFFLPGDGISQDSVLWASEDGMRTWRDAGGQNPDMPAGEEKEFYRRALARGWKARRLPVDMAFHDIDMAAFSQWWTRNVRLGHSWSQGAWVHRSPENLRQLASIGLYGVAVPTFAIGGALPTLGLSLMSLLAYRRLFRRVMQDGLAQGHSPEDARLLAGATVVGKWAGVIGVAKFLLWTLPRGQGGRR